MSHMRSLMLVNYHLVARLPRARLPESDDIDHAMWAMVCQLKARKCITTFRRPYRARLAQAEAGTPTTHLAASHILLLTNDSAPGSKEAVSAASTLFAAR